MTPTDKSPREFWVCITDAEGRAVKRDMDRLCLDYEPEPEDNEKFVHTIEHSAYLALKAEWDAARVELKNKDTIRLWNECEALKIQLANAQAEINTLRFEITTLKHTLQEQSEELARLKSELSEKG